MRIRVTLAPAIALDDEGAKVVLPMAGTAREPHSGAAVDPEEKAGVADRVDRTLFAATKITRERRYGYARI